MGAVSRCASAEITLGCCQQGPELCDASSWLAVALVVVSLWCEMTSWLALKKLLCQVCHHVSKLNGLTLTAQSLAPVQESGWDAISGARERRVLLLFHLACSYFALDPSWNFLNFFWVSILIALPKCSRSTKLIISQLSCSWSLKCFFKLLVILPHPF